MGEARRAHLGNRKTAGCQHDGGGVEVAVIGVHHEAVGLFDRRDLMRHADIDAGGRAFGQQHGHDLARRAVAEELAQRLLVPGDAVLLDQLDEIALRVAGQRRLAEMRIVREESLGPRLEVGEIAAPAARDQDLLADLLGMLEQQHPAAALAGADGAHQTGGAGARNDDIETSGPAHARAVPMIQRPSARPAIAPATEPPT